MNKLAFVFIAEKRHESLHFYKITVHIEIMHHAVKTKTDRFRMVRLTVEPFRIHHEFTVVTGDAVLHSTQVAQISNLHCFVPP